MTTNNQLTHDSVLRALEYNPETGILTWRTRPDVADNVNAAFAGKQAGGITTSGYLAVGVDGHQVRAHRLIWFYMVGRWPSHYIDHKNGIKTDNRWSNLREATPSQNTHNSVKRAGRYSSVLKGAHWDRRKQKWVARIKVNKKRYFLGLFDSDKDAHAAYRSASLKLVGEFSREA